MNETSIASQAENAQSFTTIALFLHPIKENPITDTTIVFQLDEIPVIRFRAVIRKLTHPDGAAGSCSPGEISLRSERRVFGEDVSEKGFQDRHTAAYEAGVDLDHTVKEKTDAGRSLR